MLVGTEKPKLYVTFNYYNSLFTRYPKSKLTLKLKAWTYNDEHFPKSYFVGIKPTGQKETPIKYI